MANTKSAKKAVRKITKKTAVNKSHRTRMRSEVRRVEEAIASGEADAAATALQVAAPLIARTAQRGIIHQNTAARKISRLTRRVKALSAGAWRLSCTLRVGRQETVEKAVRQSHGLFCG